MDELVKLAEELFDYCNAEPCVVESYGFVDAARFADENAEGVSPGGFVNPYGYFVIGTTVGGNAIVVHREEGNFWFADHSNFISNLSYEDRETGNWVDCEYSAENVRRALVKLADDIGQFKALMLSGELEETIDRMD